MVTAAIDRIKTRSAFSSKILTLLVYILLTWIFCVPKVMAQADDFVSQVNAIFKEIPADKRSDTVLLPLLVKMQPPPAVMSSQYRAALLSHEGPEWEACEAWATGETQKAVIEAIAKVTGEQNHRKAYAFAQPYGVEGVDLDMVSEGLYTELGEPPTLAAASFGCMPKLEQAGILMHVEASRLSKTGDPNSALDVLTNWVMFARQFADRPFMKEKEWAMRSLITGLERMRDIAYEDFHLGESAKCDPVRLRAVLEKFQVRGYISLDRLSLPIGDYLASQQLVKRVLPDYKAKTVQTDVFGPTMAKVTSKDRPLRLWSNAAYWEGVRLGHMEKYRTEEALTGIWLDWNRRWSLSPFDIIQQTKSEYVLKIEGKPQYAVIDKLMSSVPIVFKLRQNAQTELAGMRMSLAAYGYWRVYKAPPPSLTSTSPSMVKMLDVDPYSPTKKDIQYLRVGPDTPKGVDDEPIPYTIMIFPPEPLPSFQAPLAPGEFVLYSAGADGLTQRVQNATQGREGVGGDYLLWPPMVSMHRQRLKDTTGLN